MTLPKWRNRRASTRSLKNVRSVNGLYRTSLCELGVLPTGDEALRLADEAGLTEWVDPSNGLCKFAAAGWPSRSRGWTR